jgi:flagellar biosynthesis component FlhA
MKNMPIAIRNLETILECIIDFQAAQQKHEIGSNFYTQRVKRGFFLPEQLKSRWFSKNPKMGIIYEKYADSNQKP